MPQLWSPIVTCIVLYPLHVLAWRMPGYLNLTLAPSIHHLTPPLPLSTAGNTVGLPVHKYFLGRLCSDPQELEPAGRLWINDPRAG